MVLMVGHPKVQKSTFTYYIEGQLSFKNSDAILNFKYIAMHCGISRVFQLF